MSNDLAVETSQLTNSIKQMSDYLKEKIDETPTQLNAIELNFDNLEVSKTVSDIIDDSIANQKYLGGYIEIQPDSYKAVGETVLYAMLNRCKMAMTADQVNA